MEKSAQNHHQNCKPKITGHNQTQIEKEKEEEWEWEEEEDEDVRRRRKRKEKEKEETINKQNVENKEIESVRTTGTSRRVGIRFVSNLLLGDLSPRIYQAKKKKRER